MRVVLGGDRGIFMRLTANGEQSVNTLGVHALPVMEVESMSRTQARLLLWSPRVLGIGFGVFVSLFALDVFSEGLGVWQTALALLIHLIPTAILVAVLLIAWHGSGQALHCLPWPGRFMPSECCRVILARPRRLRFRCWSSRDCF
jgi:hypothetical protein